MPDFERLEDGSFQMVMIQSDAQEARVTEAIQIILQFAQIINERPFDPATRQKERGGYYRYAEVERSLQIIAHQAHEALNHIKFLDFPERVAPKGNA